MFDGGAEQLVAPLFKVQHSGAHVVLACPKPCDLQRRRERFRLTHVSVRHYYTLPHHGQFFSPPLRPTPVDKRVQHPSEKRSGDGPPSGGCSKGAECLEEGFPAWSHLIDSTVKNWLPPLVYTLPVMVTFSAAFLMTASGRGDLSLLGNRMYTLFVPSSNRPAGIPFLIQSMAH